MDTNNRDTLKNDKYKKRSGPLSLVHKVKITQILYYTCLNFNLDTSIFSNKL